MSFTFSPPPLEKPDFKTKNSFKLWDDFINGYTKYVIKTEEETVGAGNCQYYNPKYNPAGNDKADATVTWNGFPRRIRIEYPDNYYEVADKKGGWPSKDVARNQDEYLEWYVKKDNQGKITQIDFTSEGPEYFESLFEWEPKTCLDLYREYISPDVKMDELTVKGAIGQGKYDMYNKWNTTHGAMHLNCPPNSLGAEIHLAGDASIIRKNKNGEPITDSQQLINCSKYGVATRNSDPHIGSQCNQLCRGGKRITISNPVCLFIARVETSGWTTPDGKDASKYMKMVRGIEGRGLRYTLTVPESEGFTVSDIKIAGIGIENGGQIAEHMEIGLVAEACKDTKGPQPPYPCVGDRKIHFPTDHPLLKAFPFLKGNEYCVRV